MESPLSFFFNQMNQWRKDLIIKSVEMIKKKYMHILMKGIIGIIKGLLYILFIEIRVIK